MGGFNYHLKYVPLKFYCCWQGVTILLMGSKEEDVPTEPAEKPLFVEDMNESELASAVSTLWAVSTAQLTRRTNMVVCRLLSRLAYMHTFPFMAFMKSNEEAQWGSEEEREREMVLVYCITGGNEGGMVTADGH